MNFLDPRLPDRFWSKVSPIPFPTYGTTGCWLWTGATTSKGYGSFLISSASSGCRVRQVTGVAHKMTYELVHGVIVQPEVGPRIVVDHLCRNRACCNPEHLEAVPEVVNVARGTSPSALHAMKTHCPSGHEYTPVNTYVYRNKRYCKECRKP